MTVPKTKEPPARQAKKDPNPTSASPVLNAVDPATGKTIGTVPVTPEHQIPKIKAFR